MDEKTWRDYICRPWRSANSLASGGIRSKFKIIQALMRIFVTYKNEEVKDEGTRVAKTFLHLSLWWFPDAQGQLTPQSHVRAWQNLNSSKFV